MFRVGLTGLGCMGSAHLGVYRQMEKNGLPVKLAAVCDVDANKLKKPEVVHGNLQAAPDGLDLSGCAVYTDLATMIAQENLDYVDLCLPTYLHGPMAIKAMELGVHVFCEKPMAISSEMGLQMIDAVKRTGKKLMIGHTLRYWNTYEYLKEVVDSGIYGPVTAAYFFRGGGTPLWSWENWLLQKDKAGGCLLDQHIHDVDTINWLFGLPESVSSIGKVIFPDSGYDAVSTNYHYADKVVNAQDDWTINGKGFGFEMTYRVNFKDGAVVLDRNGVTTSYPSDGEKFTPELHGESGYYKEIRLFLEKLQDPASFDCIPLLESHVDTLRLAEAERDSCDRRGAVVTLAK